MILEFKDANDFSAITDDSTKCNPLTAFLLTSQNQKYLSDAKKHSTCRVFTPTECLSIFEVSQKIKIIGITGTNGKTTTAAAIYSTLLDLDKKVAFQGTRGFFLNEKRYAHKSLTTPPILETISNLKQAIDEECEYFMMEVSSHAIDQERIEGLEFALKIFTNITQDHLDYHGTFDAYVAVKSRFFEDESLKLINKDDSKIRFNRKNCMTYGVEKPSTYKITAYSLKDGVSAVLQKLDKTHDFQSPLHGFFNLYNLTATIGAIDMLRVAPLEDICKAVESFGGVEGRMEIVSSAPLVIVDFAHTPDSVEKALEALKDKDIVVVFGAGGDRDRGKRAQMGKIASRYAKKVIVTSDNPRSENPKSIIEDILSGIKNRSALHVEVDRKEAIKYALHIRDKNEIVLILGKGDESYQEIMGKKIPFDDRQIVRELLSR